MSPVYQNSGPGLGEALLNGVSAFMAARRQKHLDDLNEARTKSQLANEEIGRTAQGWRPGTPPTTPVSAPVMTADDLQSAFAVKPMPFNAAPPTNGPAGFLADLTQGFLRGAGRGMSAAAPTTAFDGSRGESAADRFEADLTQLMRSRTSGGDARLAEAPLPTRPSNMELLDARSKDFHAASGARGWARGLLGSTADDGLANAFAARLRIGNAPASPMVAPSGRMSLPTTDARYVPLSDAAGGGYVDTNAGMERQLLANAIREAFIGQRQVDVHDATKRPRLSLKRGADGQLYAVNLDDASDTTPVTLPDGTALTEHVPSATAGPPRVRVGGKWYERDAKNGEWVPALTAGGTELTEPPKPPRSSARGPAATAATATGRAITQNNTALDRTDRAMPKFPALSLNPATDSTAVIEARTPLLKSYGNLVVRGDSLQRAYDAQSSAIANGGPASGAVDMGGIRAELARAQHQLDAIMASKAPLADKARAQEAFKRRVQRLTGGQR